MKRLLVLACCLAVCLGLLDHWNSFKDSFRKKYANLKEEIFRRKVFEENVGWIAKLDELYDKGIVSFQVKMNKYGDLTEKEFNELMLTANLRPPDAEGSTFLASTDAEGSTFLASTDATDIPEAFDWREANAVSPVKDQGRCGACWAFSAIGSLESINFIKTRQMVTLSEQQLVDCSTEKYNNHGCQGGFPARAYQYILDVGGVQTDKDYPYTAKNEDCKFDISKVAVNISGIGRTESGDENALKAAVAKVGPVSVAIHATFAFRFYSKGVFNDWFCSKLSLNHAVVVVGYGTEDGKDYWLVKNSWGSSWGDSGYIKMVRNKGSRCGIASYGFYPLV